MAAGTRRCLPRVALTWCAWLAPCAVWRRADNARLSRFELTERTGEGLLLRELVQVQRARLGPCRCKERSAAAAAKRAEAEEAAEEAAEPEEAEEVEASDEE